MQPGYRKRIKANSGKAKDGGGYPNMNQVVDKIKQMTQDSEEFYEIEPAEVLEVYLDPLDPSFPQTKDLVPVPDLSFIGAVIVRLVHSQANGGTIGATKPIRPLSQHIVQYPLRGEVVNVAKYIDMRGNASLYYSNPLNLNGAVSMNRLIHKGGEGLVLPQNLDSNRKIGARQGDTLVQGRFGQSIHFGSDKNYVNPFVKITVGQSKANNLLQKLKEANSFVSHKTNINNDEASIYITTSEHVQLQTDAPSQMKAPKLGKTPNNNPKSAIVMNAETIVLNSKKNGDISAHASRHLTLAARTSINLESEFGEINLGDVNSVNPVVKGKELVLFLGDFIELCKKYSKDMKAFLTSNKDQGIIDSVNLFANPFEKGLDELTERMGPNADFYSKKVFVADDRDTKEGDELDLESLWDNTVWNEIEEVTTKEYEVEKINSGATGVSG